MNSSKETVNTEQVIMEAAEKKFMEKGFALTKTTEIAELAGVNHAMLHYYFRTKENIFEKVFEKKVQEVSASLLTIIEQDLPILERLKAGIEAHFDFIASNPQLPFFILNEFIMNKERGKTCQPIIMKAIARVYTTLKKGIEQGIKEGAILPIKPIDLLYNIVTLNVCAFIVQPIAKQLLPMEEKDYMNYLEERKAENVRTILSRIIPPATTIH